MAKEKIINVIGMDVFQTAAVKRNYANVKPLIKERNKMEEKIAELTKNLEIKKAQIAANDQHTGMITKETCGIALTSEQVMWFLEHPEEFEAFKAAHGVGESQEETTEEKPSEEAPVAEEETTVDEQENNPFPDEQ
jgi:hypothetical protein